MAERAVALEPRRAPLVALVTCVAVLGLVLGSGSGVSGDSGQQAARAIAGGAGTARAETSAVPAVALSSSWFCAGGTTPGGPAPGELVLANAGTQRISGSVEMISAGGQRRAQAVSVAAGKTRLFPERLQTGSKEWVGAVVTLYGGMASVSQLVRAKDGATEQPCASSTASQWYFAAGATLRNASAEISLLNPYPQDAVADLSFTTDQGREQPLAFQGIVVPATGLAVVPLAAHLRRRQRIALTVSVRAGRLVAYQTEIATPPPAGAPLLGSPGAENPVLPVAGVQLALGTTAPAPAQWWPDAGDGPGVTQTFDIYNPNPAQADLTLSLLSGQGSAGLPTAGARNGAGGGLTSSSKFVVAPWGSVSITTNGQPWALPSATYAARLVSTNGVPVVAERSVMAAAPSASRGLGVFFGQSAPAHRWLAGCLRLPLSARARALGQVWVAVANPGAKPAAVAIDRLVSGRAVPVPGKSNLEIAPHERAAVEVATAAAGRLVLVTASQPVLVEEDWYFPLWRAGTSLAPGAPITGG